jgi:outer membrane protein TolC
MNRLPTNAFLALALVSSACSAWAQSGGPSSAVPVPGTASTPSSLQSPLYGSVPTGTATADVLQLSIADAIQRGLKQNLGILLTGDSQIAAHGALWQQRSKLLPSVNGAISENAAQVNLLAEGFGPIAAKFPGFPTIVGPFEFFDVRARATASLLDLNALDSERSARRSEDAAKFDFQDAREAVVLGIAAAYLQTIAETAIVDTVAAQTDTAQALYNQAVNQKQAGASAGIDLLRAQVELQTRQQQLIAARNNLAKQKLALARMIGLPLDQSFVLADKAPYQPSETVTLDDLLKRAYGTRADYQSALSAEKAADYMKRAARDEHLPSAAANGDYGVIGPSPTQTHGTFTASIGVNIPIFTGNRAHGDALVAEAAYQRSQQRAENLRAQIEQDVRNALLDLQSASDQVQVAKSNVDLAQQTITQARDRFAAGLTDNIEVVQAQETLATANSSYISSLFAYNVARVDLARATGTAEKGVLEFWKEQ